MKQKFSVLIFLSLTQLSALFATAQYGDRLIVDKDTFWINSNPLEVYFDKKGSRTINGETVYGSCTALWRGYVATWQIKSDSIFLVRLQTDFCSNNPIDLDVKTEFGTSIVFANWVDNTIVQTKGSLIQYVHMGYMSIFEQEIYYKFDKGILKSTKVKKYVRYNDKQILPAEILLSMTLKNLVLKEITLDERAQFSEGMTCSLKIIFNKNRKIDKIEMSNNKQAQNPMEEVILKKAKIALTNLPKLMKVTHKRYYPPTINLFFSGHCLKMPKDREYGCDEE
ncbi:MAG: hypothetical protein K1X55_09985 [Chitinophagales bacterium]|nr:hypothetical protein [Chitinophagales bacterium]